MPDVPYPPTLRIQGLLDGLASPCDDSPLLADRQDHIDTLLEPQRTPSFPRALRNDPLDLDRNPLVHNLVPDRELVLRRHLAADAVILVPAVLEHDTPDVVGPGPGVRALSGGGGGGSSSSGTTQRGRREDLDAAPVVLGLVGELRVRLGAGRRVERPADGDGGADAREDGDGGVPRREHRVPPAGLQVLVRRVGVDEAEIRAVAPLGEVHPRRVGPGLVDAADDEGVAEPVLRVAVLHLLGPHLRVGLVAPPRPALRRHGGVVGAEVLGVRVGDQLVAALDGGADDGRGRRVHPGLDDAADEVVLLARLETVDGEPRRVHAQLDPADEVLGGGLGAFEAANVVAIRWEEEEEEEEGTGACFTYVEEGKAGVQGQRVAASHGLPGGDVVAAPRRAAVLHGPGRRAAREDKGALFRLALDGGVVGRLAHELRVDGAAPDADVSPAEEALGDRHEVRLLERALPVVVGHGVLVVVVPHDVDADPLQPDDAVVPPLVARVAGEVEVAALAALAAAGAPEPRDGGLARVGVPEEGAGGGQPLVRGVGGEHVGLDVGEQADAVGVGLAREGARVREAVVVPREDVARLGLLLGDGVAGAHLEGREGDVVLLAVPDPAHDGVVGARGVHGAVLHAAADVAHHVARHAQREADELGVRADDVGDGPADHEVLLEAAVGLAVHLVGAPHAVELGSDGPGRARVGGGEDADGALGGDVDEQRDVLVERVGAVGVVAKGVARRDEEAAAAEIHGRGLLAEADVERALLVDRVVGDAGAVGGVRAERQVRVDGLAGVVAAGVEGDDGGVGPFHDGLGGRRGEGLGVFRRRDLDVRGCRVSDGLVGAGERGNRTGFGERS
ncbi:hypothetical protein CTA1_10581 [Colletotrichum tanaceti]|uniref:Uncharacterized protein n=1 Tax=Colletotrichum tanaceti TaxID=1306861 RepID=A0A4U6X6J3_9PEZI|nr:hypothetical protein CTA1_10581 [Colletotrichum tanaceti]